MTRETKIGLLVGLAFIIVIGILLSDHLTTSTEPPQATLADAGNNVRSGVTTPGPDRPNRRRSSAQAAAGSTRAARPSAGRGRWPQRSADTSTRARDDERHVH